MKKFILSLLILISIFTFGNYILNNKSKYISEKDKTSTNKYYSNSYELQM